MIQVPLYPYGYPCKCSGACDYSKAYEDAGMPKMIDYESYIKKGFVPTSIEEKAIHKYLNTPYCDKK